MWTLSSSAVQAVNGRSRTNGQLTTSPGGYSSNSPSTSAGSIFGAWGQITEAMTERARNEAMVMSEATIGTLNQFTISIFTPTNSSTQAKPYLRKWNLSMMPA